MNPPRGHFSFLFANSQREILSLSFVRYQSMQTNGEMRPAHSTLKVPWGDPNVAPGDDYLLPAEKITAGGQLTI